MYTSVYVYQSVFIHYMCLLCRIIIIIFCLYFGISFIQFSVCVCVWKKASEKLFVNRVVCMYVFFSFFHITRYIFFILSPLYFQLFSSFFLSLETNFSRPAATYTHTQTNFHLDILRCRHKHLFEKNDIFICQRTFFFCPLS